MPPVLCTELLSPRSFVARGRGASRTAEAALGSNRADEGDFLARADGLVDAVRGYGIGPGAAIELRSALATENRAVLVRLLRLMSSGFDVKAMQVDRSRSFRQRCWPGLASYHFAPGLVSRRNDHKVTVRFLEFNSANAQSLSSGFRVLRMVFVSG